MKYGLLAGLVFTTASHASIDLKANEQGLLDYCAELGIPGEFFTAEELKAAYTEKFHKNMRRW